MDQEEFDKLKRRVEMLDRADFPGREYRLRQQLRALERRHKWEHLGMFLLIFWGWWYYDVYAKRQPIVRLDADSIVTRDLDVGDDEHQMLVWLQRGTVRMHVGDARLVVGLPAGEPEIYMNDSKGHDATLRLYNGKLAIIRKIGSGAETVKMLE